MHVWHACKCMWSYGTHLFRQQARKQTSRQAIKQMISLRACQCHFFSSFGCVIPFPSLLMFCGRDWSLNHIQHVSFSGQSSWCGGNRSCQSFCELHYEQEQSLTRSSQELTSKVFLSEEPSSLSGSPCCHIFPQELLTAGATATLPTNTGQTPLQLCTDRAQQMPLLLMLSLRRMIL